MMRIAALLVVSVFGALASGCGADASPASGGETTTGIACDYAFTYSSLSQLRRHASSVAVVEPTGAVRHRRVANLPWSDAGVRVIELISGARLPARLVLVGVADPRIQG